MENIKTDIENAELAMQLLAAIGDRQKTCELLMNYYLDDCSIDEILRVLIKDSDVIEVACCLDFIFEEEGRMLVVYDKNERVYPVPGVKTRINLLSHKDGGATHFDPPPLPDIEVETEDGLAPVSNVYKGGFFKNRNRLFWRCSPVCQALISAFDLKTKTARGASEVATVVDVGCALGEYVKHFNETGISAWGIEGSTAAGKFAVTQWIQYLDLRKPLPGDISKYGGHTLAYSFEVAEHIEEEYADVYVSTLCQLSDCILITAAPPGQKGHGHVNCQPKEYWIEKFKVHGYDRCKPRERNFIAELKPFDNHKELACYINNVLVFERVLRRDDGEAKNC